MSAHLAEKKVWTPDTYLAWEREQPDKHELYQGEIFAMAGASFEHNRIVGNLLGLLWTALAGKPCQALPSDMRVKVPATGLYTYPDVTIVCGRPDLEDGDTLLNPGILVEVLSKSSEAYDRGSKFEQYQTIPSFQEYVLAAQDRVRVEHFVRQADGAWLMRSGRAGDTVELVSIGCALAVDDIYRGVFDDRSSAAG